MEGMPFVLEEYVEPGISLGDSEIIEMGDIAQYEKSVSSTLGMPVKVLSLSWIVDSGATKMNEEYTSRWNYTSRALHNAWCLQPLGFRGCCQIISALTKK